MLSKTWCFWDPHNVLSHMWEDNRNEEKQEPAFTCIHPLSLPLQLVLLIHCRRGGHRSMKIPASCTMRSSVHKMCHLHSWVQQNGRQACWVMRCSQSLREKIHYETKFEFHPCVKHHMSPWIDVNLRLCAIATGHLWPTTSWWDQCTLFFILGVNLWLTTHYLSLFTCPTIMVLSYSIRILSPCPHLPHLSFNSLQSITRLNLFLVR